MGFRGDVQRAFRALGNSTGFTAAALATLALAIGANTAVFSAIDAFLLRPLPFSNAARLVSVHETQAGREPQLVSLVTMFDWKARAHCFQALAAYRARTWGMTAAGQTAPVIVVRAGMVTPDFFTVFSARPALGRGFIAEDSVPGKDRIVWLSDALWRSRFHSDPHILGRSLSLNAEPRTVVGVMPPEFRVPLDGTLCDLYFPLEATGRDGYGGSRNVRSLHTAALLRPGVTLAAASTEMAALATALSAEYPATNRGYGAGIEPLQTAWSASRKAPLELLMGASALLLLIAVVNVANLLLARAAANSKQVAIRVSLGAGRCNLLSHFLAEGLAIALPGCLLGIASAYGCLSLMRLSPRWIASNGAIAAVQDLRLDWLPLLFALAVAFAAALLFGLAPAISQRADPGRLLWRERATRHSGPRLPDLLVVTEVALSAVLVLSVSLLIHMFWRIRSTNPGFDPENVVVFGIGLPEARYDTDTKLLEFHEKLLARLAALPGVDLAAAGTPMPMTAGLHASFQREGKPLPLNQRPSASIHVASNLYFRTMRIPLLAGRTFNSGDRAGSPPTCLINQTMARRFWNGEDPVGQSLFIGWANAQYPKGATWRIAGIVGDTRQKNLETPPPPQIYLPLAQFPPETMIYFLHVSRSIGGLSESIRDATAGLDPALEQVRPRPMEAAIEATLSDRRQALVLLGSFGGLALLLAAIGIYGVLSYRVARRSKEIGIRIAMGQRPLQTVRHVTERGMSLIAAGGFLGWIASFWTVRLLASEIAGLPAVDGPATAGAALVLITSGLLACLIPALRASRIDPVNLLRED